MNDSNGQLSTERVGSKSTPAASQSTSNIYDKVQLQVDSLAANSFHLAYKLDSNPGGLARKLREIEESARLLLADLDSIRQSMDQTAERNKSALDKLRYRLENSTFPHRKRDGRAPLK